MRAQAMGETASRLSWLCPRAASMVALARSPAAMAWNEIRFDPGAILLAARYASAADKTSSFSVLYDDPTVLEGALRHLANPDTGHVDWRRSVFRPVYLSGLSCARIASFLAESRQCCDTENAWAAGLLAPLGWMALCAASPDQAADFLALKSSSDFDSHDDKLGLDGLDPLSIARRLARRWLLPRWLFAVVGHLNLPAETARSLGADLDLFRVVRLAVALVGRHGGIVPVPDVPAVADAAQDLGIASDDLPALERKADELCASPAPDLDWQSPSSFPLLQDLLILAVENRKLAEAPVIDRLECDVDGLHRILREQRESEESRLRERKLRALAEFAAGAGHEINNPLAVISGQAQYLLGHEPDPARQRALQTIVNQATRIHQTLTDLMQFSRPSCPQKQRVDVAGLIAAVTDSLRDLAEQKQVRLECPLPTVTLSVRVDPRQARIALTCLLRNAIEAASKDGWAGVRTEVTASDFLEFVVEDDGGGPAPAQVEHLFDPFYSGREAGRGRGLGLSTAWQLARVQGGEVRYDGVVDGITRFVLHLPRWHEPDLVPSPPPNGAHRPLALAAEPPANGSCAESGANGTSRSHPSY